MQSVKHISVEDLYLQSEYPSVGSYYQKKKNYFHFPYIWTKNTFNMQKETI